MERFQRMVAWLAAFSALCAGQTIIPEGSKVRVRLEQTLSSATAEEGQTVQLSVIEEVRNGDTTVISQGASVTGTVVQAVAKRRMGRTGKLDFSIDRVIAADGDAIPLRYGVTKKEGGSHSLRAGIIAGGAAVVFWPAAPVFLLMKGKDTTINRGVTFDVFTDQNHVLRKPAAAAAPAPPLVPPPAAAADTPPGEKTALTIASDTAGAEIEMDGAFVGSTPTTLSVNPGLHKITVRHGSESWQRDIRVYPGSSISIMAAFKKR